VRTYPCFPARWEITQDVDDRRGANTPERGVEDGPERGSDDAGEQREPVGPRDSLVSLNQGKERHHEAESCRRPGIEEGGPTSVNLGGKGNPTKDAPDHPGHGMSGHTPMEQAAKIADPRRHHNNEAKAAKHYFPHDSARPSAMAIMKTPSLSSETVPPVHGSRRSRTCRGSSTDRRWRPAGIAAATYCSRAWNWNRPATSTSTCSKWVISASVLAAVVWMRKPTCDRGTSG
jgi:hypothetical protein